ncbi:phage tail protein [Mycobacterium intracellulare]|uniref:Tape measure protein n=1 Tax=Mycobacterium intracellulare TaxID=1767 RepID=A0AAE4R7W3_MYCIT|nr:hypothetical protein [Mycobacterium intracellulare]MDV6975341.1 hypothetical protein [Mycobacterium intracellulare]MDV6980405.1 hypothetical protein [Mycobacterium intracellulare]MDV7010834.1 hypothetical protein [Mycobacterium intracellulare]MDV7025740.1 hypothetical protein [Mycobacterium intracellulare]
MAEGGAGGKEVGRISIRVVPNLDKFWRDLKAKIEEAEKALEGKIRFTADFDSRGLREKVDAAAKTAGDKVKFKADLDQSDFAKTLAEAKALASEAGLKLKVDIRDKEAEAKLAATLLKLKAEAAAAKIKVNVDVDRKINRKGGFLSGIGDGISGLASGAGGALKALSDDTTLIAAAIVSVGAPALALLAGGLAALPALIAGVAVPLGVLTLGFKGIGQALDASGILSEGKKGKQGVGPALKALQDTLAKKFQDGFTPIFQRLAPMLPAIGTALLPIADRIVGMASALTDVVTSSSGMKAIQTTIDGIAQAMSVITPGIKAFADGLLNLIAGGSKSLPGFARVFDNFATRFQGWVDKVSTNDWWGTSPLSRGIGAFQGVLDHLLQGLGKIASGAFDLLQDPKFVQNMEKFVDSIATLVTNSLPALKEIFGELAGILDKIANFHQPKWMKDFLNEDARNPGPNKKPDVLFPDFDTSDNFNVNWGSIWDKIKSAFKMPNVAEGGNPFGKLGDWISSAVDGINWGGIWNKITTWFNSTADSLGANPFGKIGEWFSSAFDSIDWSGIWSKVTSVFDTSGGSLGGSMLGDLGAKIKEAFSGIDLSGIWSSITQGASGMWDSVVGAARTAWNSIVEAVQTAGGNVVSFVQGLPGKIVAALGDLGGLLVAAGKAAMDGLLSGIKQGAEAVYNFVKGIADKIASLKGPLPYDRKVLIPNGQALMTGLQDGLEGGFEGVLGRAKAMAQQISDAMAQGIKPAGIKDQLKQTLDAIGAEYNQLRLQKDQAPDKATKATISDQMKQLQLVRDQLRVQSDQLGITNKNADGQSTVTDQLGQQFGKMIDIGKSFAMANVSQFEKDVGISGSGALPTLAEQGIGWLTSTLSNLASGAIGGGGTTIQVNSVDDALAARQNILNKQALQYAGR